jgi:hypothetical protein
LLAPPLGGILYEKTGQKGVFGFAFALLGLDFVLRILVIEPSVSSRYSDQAPSSSHDPAAWITRHQVHSEEEQPSVGETTQLLPQSTRSDYIDSFSISPELPAICRRLSILPCLADKRFLSSLFLAFVQALLLGSFDATVPIIAQEYYKLAPLTAGLLFLPLGLFNLALGPVFGRCVDRFGTKPMAVIGYFYLAIVLLLLWLPQPGTFNELLVYGGFLALCGIGLAGISAPPIVEAATILERYYDSNKDFYENRKPYTQLYGLNNIVFCAGLTLGPELAGELKEAIGYGYMNMVLAFICLIAGVLSWIYIGVKSNTR